MPSTPLAAAAAVLALSAAAFAAQPAAAQDSGPSDAGPSYVYGSVGYTGHSVGDTDLGTVGGQLGYRLDRWFGVEGEVDGGVSRNAIGGGESARINDQQAVYGVGYLPPVLPHLDLFGRVGVERTDWDYNGPDALHSLDTSWNVGAGGMYFVDRHDGLRVEYTRENFEHAPSGNDWTASLVRRF